ncbi:MAG: polymer-forming cytoskeletal protein [Prevotella sp.]|nr:polymer-forming cytoskeletal protein [Prevotella sp.]
MSLKDNFNQAVKEILKKDGLVGDDLSKESKKRSELDKYIDPPRKAEQPYAAEQPYGETEDIMADNTVVSDGFASAGGFSSASEFAETKEPEPSRETARMPEPEPAPGYSDNPYVKNAQSAADFGARPSQPFAPDPFGMGAQAQSPRSYTEPQGLYGSGTQNYGGGMPPTPPRVPNNPPPRFGGGNDTPYYETEETTIISRNTIIDGNIRSFANINIDGSVKGDVRITKDINVTGKVVGDIECNNSVMSGASMQGNISSKGQVQLDRDSILLGDIGAQYLDMNGKIKGNIDIGGKAEFKTDAVVLGNITASTITVLDGATIQGYVNTTFLQESTANIFPETIAVTE